MRGTVALLAILLAGCSSAETTTTTEQQPMVMGNATPASSPDADPDGKTYPISAPDAAVAGAIVALRDGTTVRIGSTAELTTDKATEFTIDAECGELSATDNTFVLPCDEEIFLINAANPDLETVVAGEQPYTSAVLTSTGTIIAGGIDNGKLSVLGEQSVNTITAGKRADQLVRTPSDSVAVINRAETVIQGVLWQDPQPGASLRVGLGVGRITAGDDDVVFATDTIGNQLAVYTLDPVIRLHQTAPVAESPWALTWDREHHVVWVASTGSNTVTAYHIKTGVPQAQGTLNTIANVRSVELDNDGNLLLGSDTELQVIDADTLENALS